MTNRVIWKYQLLVTDEQIVTMPKEAKALSVAVQNETLTLWALVDQTALLEPRTVFVVGTGNLIAGRLGRFVGSVLMPPFVWHVFIEQTFTEELAGLF